MPDPCRSTKSCWRLPSAQLKWKGVGRPLKLSHRMHWCQISCCAPFSGALSRGRAGCTPLRLSIDAVPVPKLLAIHQNNEQQRSKQTFPPLKYFKNECLKGRDEREKCDPGRVTKTLVVIRRLAREACTHLIILKTPGKSHLLPQASTSPPSAGRIQFSEEKGKRRTTNHTTTHSGLIWSRSILLLDSSPYGRT